MSDHSDLGKARDDHLHDLRTRWRGSYAPAVQKAREGKPTDLISMLRARRPLDDDGFEALANWIEDLTRNPGNQANAAAHDAAQLFYALREIRLASAGGDRLLSGERENIIEAACAAVDRYSAEPVNREAVSELIRKARARR